MFCLKDINQTDHSFIGIQGCLPNATPPPHGNKALLRPHQGMMMMINNPSCSWFHGCSFFAEADSFEVMKQNKLGTFDLTQIAGGPLGNFAQQAPKLGRDELLWKWLKWYYIIYIYCIYDMIWYMFLLWKLHNYENFVSIIYIHICFITYTMI